MSWLYSYMASSMKSSTTLIFESGSTSSTWAAWHLLRYASFISISLSGTGGSAGKGGSAGTGGHRTNMTFKWKHQNIC